MNAQRLLITFLLLLSAGLVCGCDCDSASSTDSTTTTSSAFGPDCTSTDGSDSDNTTGDGSTGTGTLLFSDVAANSIRRFENVGELDSTTVTEPGITGTSTRMTRPGFLTMHPTNNELIVCDEGSKAVLFFDDPLNATGNIPPTRVLVGANTELVAPTQAFVDTENDELYVLDRGGSRVLVFPAGATINADVAPIRRIGGSSTGITSPAAFIVRPSINQMTIICPTEILTFSDVRTINGDVPPSGRVSGANTTFQNLTYGEFDGSNSLIVVDRGTKSILYFDGFDSDQNNVAPTRILQGNNTGISEPAQFVLTGSGGMYLANGQNVLFFDDVQDLEGNNFPDRKFSALDPASQGIRGLLAP